MHHSTSRRSIRIIMVYYLLVVFLFFSLGSENALVVLRKWFLRSGITAALRPTPPMVVSLGVTEDYTVGHMLASPSIIDVLTHSDQESLINPKNQFRTIILDWFLSDCVNVGEWICPGDVMFFWKLTQSNSKQIQRCKSTIAPESIFPLLIMEVKGRQMVVL